LNSKHDSVRGTCGGAIAAKSQLRYSVLLETTNAFNSTRVYCGRLLFSTMVFWKLGLIGSILGEAARPDGGVNSSI